MRRRGFTIVEMMVVISIIGLLSAALVVFLLGSEDRRCRLEAERLAAYLQTASAEAVMRDGPLRVVVDLDEQKCTREISEVGADIRGLGVDTAAHTGEECDGRCTHSESCDVAYGEELSFCEVVHQ